MVDKVSLGNKLGGKRPSEMESNATQVRTIAGILAQGTGHQSS